MRWQRLVTVPGYVAAWCVWLSCAPIWLVIAGLVDLVRGVRGVALRSGILVAAYLTCEVLGLIASGCLWLWRAIFGFDEQRWVDLHFRLEAWWGTTVLRCVVAIFGLRFEVETEADLGRGPYLLILRHASSGDTLLASALVSSKYGTRLRYVLKQELRWDPCLDIVGSRLPNVFVDRGSDDSAGEIERIRELGRGLGPRDGVLIYPEGTRFSESKQQRVLDRLEKKGDASLLEFARSLKNVLPPRPGGVLALLEEAADADVIVCAHSGFEGAASMARVWHGDLVNRVIRVQFRRIPRDQIPAEREARIEWLHEEWQRVDEWVGRHS